MRDAREKVWRTRERYANYFVRQADRWGCESLMVWGGISWRHKTPLVVVRKSDCLALTTLTQTV